MHQHRSIAIGVLLAGLAWSTVAAQAQAIPMRGLRGDLSSTADRFISADLNGDGKSDMLYFRPGSGYAGAYLSHGDGTFRYLTYVNDGHGSSGFPGDLSSPNDKFVVLDLNGDGKSDFIQYRPGTGYTIRCLSKGDGTVTCDLLSTPGSKSSNFQDDMSNSNTRILELPRRGASSEFLVYTPGSSTANFYTQQPGSTALQPISLTSNPNLALGLSTTLQSASVNIVSLDANGDGLPDMLVYATSNAGSVAGIACLYLNNGNNTFTRKTLSTPGSGFTGDPHDPNSHAIALDLDGDGKQDFLWWQAGSHIVTGYLSNGDGTFKAVNYDSNGSTAHGFYPEDDSRSPADIAVALDANGDGKQDFIWYTPGNLGPTIYLSSSTGALNGASLNGGGGQFGPGNAQDIALPLNFLGQAASGFVWYTPGSGQNGGQPFFRAYTLADADLNSSLFGKLNHFDFFTYPGNFLSELNWSIGNVPLKEIVMPGTHDSSMYYLNSGPVYYRETQLGDYLHQLAYGARAFDFRMGYLTQAGNNNYVDPGGSNYTLDTLSPSVPGFAMTGHGNTATGYMTKDVLNTLESWLLQNPNEVVLLYMVQSISGGSGDFTSQFQDLLQQTNYPDMIYTQKMGCGTVPCNSYFAQPQNMTINQLQQMGPLPNGARLILLNGDSGMAKYGSQWSGATGGQVGYCENDVNNGINTIHFGGSSFPKGEIDCIDYGALIPGFPTGSAPLSSERPSFQAADAAAGFTPMVAALTPFGLFVDAFTALLTPIELADGPLGFNEGTNDQYNLNNHLAAGAWNTEALNTVSIDGLGGNGEAVVPLIIPRNNQTWIDKRFFNNNNDTPAGALSISVNGDVWAAGSGHSISLFKLNTATGVWTAVTNRLPNVIKLAADPQGGVYVIQGSSPISTSGMLLHFDKNGASNGAYSQIVQDIATGGDGSLWVAINGQVKQYLVGNGVTQINVTHAGTHVAVDNLGRPWVTQATGEIYHYDGYTWIRVAANSGTSASEIVASAEGSVFVTGLNQPSVLRYNSQTDHLDPFIMDATHIAVEPGGQPWAIRTGTGKVYKGALDQM